MSGLCAYAVVDTTEVLSDQGRWGLSIAEECNNDSAEVYGTGEELVGQHFWARGY